MSAPSISEKSSGTDAARTADGSNSALQHNSDPEMPVQQAETGDEKSSLVSPDGGLAAWLVVLGAWCTSFCSFGWLNSIGVFQEYYQNDLLKQYSPSTVSWIVSLQIFFILGMGPVVGMIYDRYGTRWLLLVGTTLHILGVMMTSLGKEYYQILLAQGVCSAIGVSAIFQPAFTAVNGWFTTKRGLAFGVLVTGSSTGGVVLPIMVQHLIPRLGFGWAMRICGFTMLGLLIIANLTVRPFYPPRPQKMETAEMIKPLKELDFILVVLGAFFFCYGFFPPINYIQVGALDAGVNPNLSQYLIPILNAASLFGRLTTGIASDRLGAYNIFVVVCTLSGIWILTIWLTNTGAAATVIFAILFGYSSAAYVSLLPHLIMVISPKNFADIGWRTGIVFLAMAVGGFTTNPINGAIMENSGGWKGLKIFSGVFCLAGAFFVLLVRVRRVGFNLFVKI
ncbi:hypothetical protein TCE0_060f19151 [Talaromyces pinophilus]|uniref:Major facilitator superfamily (MFS) profile domain-containing protein n=1 Tax=Talaromyces pinophilus TaxID=128442 RepID=A0A6V8HQD9_TALPI|nr:hypothetical protein TCE0_060f19151 [Talaromyces pinophilus]